MKTQLDERKDLVSKIENISSIETIRQIKTFIAGMEAGKALDILQKKERRTAESAN